MIGIICFFIIILGLTLRSTVPFMGDFLWAALIFFLFSFVFMHASRLYKFIIPLLFCYFIECTQLYHADWIQSLRENSVFQLVLGHGVFGITDLVAYTLAITVSLAVTAIIEHRMVRKRPNSSISIARRMDK